MRPSPVGICGAVWNLIESTFMKVPKSRTAGGAFGLERKYVTSAEVFDLESSQVFSKHWVCVDHVSKLGNECVKPISVADNRLVVVGDGTGGFRAFRNFCRHRGSLLVTEENCQKIGRRIQCPYHAWTYERDGSLVAAPNMGDVEFDMREFGLVEVGCAVYGGFVWVCAGPELSIEEFLKPIESQFKDYQISELVVAKEIEYLVRANWKLIFQNYSECYHCPSVHPALNQLTPFENSTNLVEAGPILGGPMGLAEGCETMSMDGKNVAEPFCFLEGRHQRLVNYFTVFPSLFLSTHPDYVLVHRIERKSMNTTRVVCQFLFHPSSSTRAEFDPSRAVEFWDMTNRQDWKVCELAQAGMEDPCYRPGPYSDLESVVAAFDRHYIETLYKSS